MRWLAVRGFVGFVKTGRNTTFTQQTVFVVTPRFVGGVFRVSKQFEFIIFLFDGKLLSVFFGVCFGILPHVLISHSSYYTAANARETIS